MAVEIKVPEMGESITEATIAGWTKSAGDYVEADEILVELETDKVTLEVPAPASGTLGEITKQNGDTVTVAEIIGTIEEGAAPAASAPAANATAPAQTSAPVASSASGTSVASNDTLMPAVRKLIAENGLDPASIQGSGKGGQILKEDVLKALQNKPASAPAPTAAPAATAAPAPVITPQVPDGGAVTEEEELVPMTRLRQAIAGRLVSAQQTAAILTTFNEVDMSGIMNLRKQYKEKFKDEHEVGLGFMSFFTKAATQALKAYPAVNAEIRDNNIVYKKFYHVGVAVGGPKGLVVPVVRHADKLSFAQIEKEIGRLAGKVQKGNIGLDDMQGGTFTISNGGVYGSMLSTPILNPPQTGILGMHNITQRPVVVDGEVVVRPMMYLALSYDHRLIDGREAVLFLVKIKEAIEDPMRLLLEV